MNLLNLLAQTIDPANVHVPKGDLTGTSVQTALRLVFGFGGSVAFLIIVVAGLRFITSQGNPEGVNKSRSTIIYAVVGLVVCAIGYSIVTFVLGSLS